MDIQAISAKLQNDLQSFLGYPCNTAYDYTELCNIFQYHINNVGAPLLFSQKQGTYKPNTKEIEKWVIEYFADLWHLNKDEVWGCLTHSGSESNLHALFVGRESLGNQPIFLTSVESHYSIFKIAKILKLDMCLIQALPNGEMDYSDFEKHVQENLTRTCLINVNIGTTMKGALDNLREIWRILDKYNKKDVYIHGDAALIGFCLPFMESDIYFKRHLNSLSISGHKFLGVPFPCSILLMEKPFLSLISSHIPYIASDDCTISGSRNGHSAIYLKYILTKMSHADFQKDIEKCIELAEYVVENIPHSFRNNNSFTVVFPKPDQDIVEKYQLACENDIAHIVVMPHVTWEKLNEFIKEYVKNKSV